VAPTITFHDNAAHRYLSIVSDTPGHYSIRRTNPGAGADGIRSMLQLLACISLFFDGNDKELSAYIEHLARESGRP
jgi:hypothetical protein